MSAVDPIREIAEAVNRLDIKDRGPRPTKTIVEVCGHCGRSDGTHWVVPEGWEPVEVELPDKDEGAQVPVAEGPAVAEEAWGPLPLTEAAASGAEPPEIAFGGLVYAGLETILSGEPGVGKSMVAAAVVAEEAKAGRTTIYIDFERRPQMLRERLEAAGLVEEEIARVLYLRPTAQAPADAIRRMVETHRPSLVVVDSYDAALAAFGYETKNEHVRAFHQSVLTPLRSTGAGLLTPDHVAKDREARGRYSIGAQAKLALADAHLGLTTLTALRRGAGGKLKVRVHKDNDGWLPRGATFELFSGTADSLSWKVLTSGDDADEDTDDFRPTGLMEKVSRALEIAGEPQSRNRLEENVKGKATYVRQAVGALVREGFAEEVDGPRGARLVQLVRPYREADEEHGE